MFGYEEELQESIVAHRTWLRKLIAQIESTEAEFEPRLPGYMIPTFHRLTELSDEAKAFLDSQSGDFKIPN